MAGKEGIFVILDVGKSMKKKYQDTEETRLNFGIESIRQLIRSKLLFNVKRDQIGIILMGKDGDENEAENVNIHTELDFPSIELLDRLNTIEAEDEEDKGDIFFTLDFAIDEFVAKYGKKKWEKKIFLITDGESMSSFSEKKIEELAERINENGIKVNIICVDFYEELDKDDDDEEEPKEKDKDLDKDNIEEDEEQRDKDKENTNSINKETKNQKKTKELLKILQSNTDNVKLFTATTANDIYHQFKRKKINPVAKFRGPFIISPNLSLDVMVYSKTTPALIPSLKRFSKVAEYSDEPGTCEVQNERIYYVNDDPDKKAVEKELITKAYYYGSSLVPISKTDEIRLKNEEPKCLKVIGMTDSYRVPRHFFMSGVDIVVPNPTSEEDIKGTTALVKEMIKMNKVIIARYVYRNNSQPKLVVLTPHMSKKGPMFYLNVLPTVEEIRDFQFDSLPEATKKQEEFMGHFIDSLDLEQDGEEEIKPTETYNPMLQYFYKCLEHKALETDENKKNELPKIDEESIKYMIPNKKLFENNKYVTFLPKVFPIIEKDKIEDKKKRVFWKDVITNEFEDRLTQQRIEEKLNAKKPESKKTISAITPIEDFREMIDNKNEDLAAKAMELMSDMICKLIRESFKGSYYIKAIECIKAYRDAANDEDEVDLFNTFLNELKEKFPKDQYMDFWILFCDNKITLISEKENERSKYTEKQCNDWLEEISKQDAIPTTVKDIGDLLIDVD